MISFIGDKAEGLKTSCKDVNYIFIFSEVAKLYKEVGRFLNSKMFCF